MKPEWQAGLTVFIILGVVLLAQIRKSKKARGSDGDGGYDGAVSDGSSGGHGCADGGSDGSCGDGGGGGD